MTQEKKLKAIGWVQSFYEDGNAQRNAEISREYALIVMHAEKLGVELVDVFGAADIYGNPISVENSTSLEYAYEAIKTHNADFLIVASERSVGGFKGFTPGSDVHRQHLKSIDDHVKWLGAKLEVAIGPSIQSVIDGPLPKVKPGQKYSD